MKTIEIISQKVSDQQKSKDYYLKLGFEVIVEAPMGNGETWVQLGIPGQATSLSLMNFQSVILETEDMEKELGDLRAKGIETGKIDETPWGKFSQLKDPDGNNITLHQK